jgi:hypothetical protein
MMLMYFYILDCFAYNFLQGYDHRGCLYATISPNVAAWPGLGKASIELW